jgi:hypothetical protein
LHKQKASHKERLFNGGLGGTEFRLFLKKASSSLALIRFAHRRSSARLELVVEPLSSGVPLSNTLFKIKKHHLGAFLF